MQWLYKQWLYKHIDVIATSVLPGQSLRRLQTRQVALLVPESSLDAVHHFLLPAGMPSMVVQLCSAVQPAVKIMSQKGSGQHLWLSS